MIWKHDVDIYNFLERVNLYRKFREKFSFTFTKKWSFKEQQFDWFQNFSRKDNNDIFIKFRQIWVSFEFTLIIPLSRFLLSFRVLSGCMECLWRLVKLMLVYVWQVWAIIWIEYELCVLLVCFYTLENGGNLDFSR